MRVVVAVEPLSPSLDARTAGAAAARGWRRARDDDEVSVVPLSNGGAGLLDALGDCLPGTQRFVTEVADARGCATNAEWLRLPDGTGVVESAQACGLDRLPADQRNPRLTTSYGAGQLLTAAVTAGVSAIIVGVGDSAATDGGGGLATAMGHRLLRADGNRLKVGGEFLADLDRVVAGPALGVAVTGLCDAGIVLLGPQGAAATYAPAQGAPDADLEMFENNLQRLADTVERDMAGGPWRDQPGAGAGGGMGFGLAAFAGARLAPAASGFAELVGLAQRLAAADLLVTAAAPSTGAPAEAVRLAGDHGCRIVTITPAEAETTDPAAVAELTERAASAIDT